jgi:phage-related protein
MALPDLGDGIGQFLTSMAIVAPEAAKFFGQFLRFTADLLRGLGQLIGFLTRLADGFVSMVKTVGSVVAAIGRMFWEAYQGWKIIIRVIRGDTELLQRMIGNAIRIIKEWWGRLWGTDVPGAIRAGVAAVVGVARLIPGRILGAIASLPGQMYQAGRNILQSLINGITSKLGGLRSIMSDAASIARAFWPFSPAKMGPLSGSGSLWYAGRNLVDDLTGGMQSRLPAVQSASSQLAGAVGVGSAGSMAAAGGRITIGSDGSRLGDLLLSVLQESVRARGGVDVVFAR